MALFHFASVVDAAALCFGADGHVALEDQAVRHQSVGLVTSVAFVDDVADFGARGHGACLDVVVEAGHDTGSTVKFVPAPAVSVPIVDIAIADVAVLKFSPTSLPYLACLSSTVLRT
jgi:hypothetical protein